MTPNADPPTITSTTAVASIPTSEAATGATLVAPKTLTTVGDQALDHALTLAAPGTLR
jgi:hypothetical protein